MRVRSLLLLSFTASLAVPACGGHASQAPPSGVTSSDGGSSSGSLTADAGILAALDTVPSQGSVVTFYPAGATSSTPSSGQLTWSPPQYVGRSIAFDATHALYVASSYVDEDGGTPSVSRIDVFSAGATGVAQPVRTIMGPDTGLGNVAGIAVDAQGEVYAANAGATYASTGVVAFAAGASGDVAPERSFTAYAVGGANAWGPTSLALGPDGLLYVSGGGNVAMFPASASGVVQPSYTMGLSAPAFTDATGVAIDLGTSTVYVVDFVAVCVDAFGDAGIGHLGAGNDDSTPSAVIAGSATDLMEPLSVAIDAAGRILVADVAKGVVVYAPGASGNAAPVAVLPGPYGSAMGVAVAP